MTRGAYDWEEHPLVSEPRYYRGHHIGGGQVSFEAEPAKTVPLSALRTPISDALDVLLAPFTWRSAADDSRAVDAIIDALGGPKARIIVEEP